MEYFCDNPLNQAVFNADKMGKSDLFKGDHLFAGLNAFRAGQIHEPHVHCDRDKLYFVLEGTGTATVADQERVVEAGSLIFAPANIEHSMRADQNGDLVVGVILSPPPPMKKS